MFDNVELKSLKNGLKVSFNDKLITIPKTWYDETKTNDMSKLADALFLCFSAD